MTEAQKRSRKKRRLIAIGGGAVAILAGVGAVSASRSKTEIDPSKLGTVERGDIARSVVATGKIEPLSKVEVKSKASGIVNHIMVEAGDRVRKGQVLLELDKEELQARHREAQATLLSAQASLQRTHVEAQGPDQVAYENAVAVYNYVSQVLGYRIDLISDIRMYRKILSLP